MLPIFSMRVANNLVGMGRDAFCQAILFLLQLIIGPASPTTPDTSPRGGPRLPPQPATSKAEGQTILHLPYFEKIVGLVHVHY